MVISNAAFFQYWTVIALISIWFQDPFRKATIRLSFLLLLNNSLMTFLILSMYTVFHVIVIFNRIDYCEFVYFRWANFRLVMKYCNFIEGYPRIPRKLNPSEI